MPSSHLILCCPLLLLPPIPPSIRVFSFFFSLRVFSNESTLLMRWPKYWIFSFSISPSNEHPGLISFRMDWLDLLAVQGTLKSLLQHHSSKAPTILSIIFSRCIHVTTNCNTLLWLSDIPLGIYTSVHPFICLTSFPSSVDEYLIASLS